MFHKLMIATAASMGLAIPMGAASTANAGDFSIRVGFGKRYHAGYRHRGHYHRYRRPVRVYRPVYNRHFHVDYRDCDYGPWRRYATYGSHSLAHEVVDRLEFRGYEARVVHH